MFLLWFVSVYQYFDIWDDWMASSTQWTWIWANSSRERRTGKSGAVVHEVSKKKSVLSLFWKLKKWLLTNYIITWNFTKFPYASELGSKFISVWHSFLLILIPKNLCFLDSWVFVKKLELSELDIQVILPAFIFVFFLFYFLTL